MKIKQFFASESIKFTNDFYARKYNLQLVNDSGYKHDEPCLFCGIYRKEDLHRLLNHKGLRMVLWGGGDAKNKAVTEIVAMIENVINISQSHWITDALKESGIEDIKFVPLPHTDVEYWQPCPRGEKVYCYAPNEVYNRFLAEEVAKLIPYETIFTNACTQYSREQIREFYKQSFVGIRLRQFDGISATVQQMGLMGRRTIWNGKTPSAIPWKTISDIVKAVNDEYNNVGVTDSVASDVYNYLCKDNSWLEV